MTNPIVLAFHPDGEIEYTRNKEFMPFDGMGVMQRVTEITKDPYANHYYIRWMRGPWMDCFHTRLIARHYFTPEELHDLEAEGKCPKFSPEHMRAYDPMRFESYEDAVLHEVACLNQMRRMGVSFK
jgi:hypothetical protein